MCACVRVCVCACVRACVRACVCVIKANGPILFKLKKKGHGTGVAGRQLQLALDLMEIVMILVQYDLPIITCHGKVLVTKASLYCVVPPCAQTLNNSRL